MCADSYSVSLPPLCYADACKRPSHFAKSAGGRLHLNMHTPFTHQSWSGLTMPLSRQCGDLSGNKLTCNSSGNTRPQSSQLAEPPWTDPDLKSGISLRKLISTLKKKKCKLGMNCQRSPQILAHEKKATTTTTNGGGGGYYTSGH